MHIKSTSATVLQVFIVLASAGLLIYYIHTVSELEAQATPPEDPAPEVVLDPRFGLPIDPATQLIMGEGYGTIKKTCVKCHPTQLIITYKQDRAGWLDAIRWMQAEKGLEIFDEGTEDTLLKYLSTYYGP